MARPAVHGIDLDGETRCTHWHSPRDIVAIRMKCCGEYYACKDCHDALADHPPQMWPLSERDTKAVLCGACGQELTIRQYMESGTCCPNCAAEFNPGCASHHHFYFEMV